MIFDLISSAVGLLIGFLLGIYSQKIMDNYDIAKNARAFRHEVMTLYKSLGHLVGSDWFTIYDQRPLYPDIGHYYKNQAAIFKFDPNLAEKLDTFYRLVISSNNKINQWNPSIGLPRGEDVRVMEDIQNAYSMIEQEQLSELLEREYAFKNLFTRIQR